MNEGYNYSSDKSFQWNNTQSTLKGTNTSEKEKENETENHFIKAGIQRLIVSLVSKTLQTFFNHTIYSYKLCSFDLHTVKLAKTVKELLTKEELIGMNRKSNVSKMSLKPVLTKLLCMSVVTCSLGILLLLCLINVTYSKGESNNLSHNKETLDSNDYNLSSPLESIYRKSRQYKKFKSSARNSEELLNDITSYGLEKSRYLYDIKEKRIYDKGISLKKSDPAHFVSVFNKQTPRAKELSRYGYATLEASSLLTKQ